MPNDYRGPQMWTMGSGASVLVTGALAGLFAAFFVISLFRHFGAGALAFGAGGAVLMIALMLVQWRVMKSRRGDGPG